MQMLFEVRGEQPRHPEPAKDLSYHLAKSAIMPTHLVLERLFGARASRSHVLARPS